MQTLTCLYKTILLIDDDEDDCYLFHRAVSEISNDLVVNCAYSSDNLLKVLESAQPSIIFIDLHLPKQNGLACLRQIRSIPSLEHIPVIFWSGSCDAKIVTSAYHEGAQYYFEKPCCIKELEEELKNILYTHQGVNNTVYSASDEKLLPTF